MFVISHRESQYSIQIVSLATAAVKIYIATAIKRRPVLVFVYLFPCCCYRSLSFHFFLCLAFLTTVILILIGIDVFHLDRKFLCSVLMKIKTFTTT